MGVPLVTRSWLTLILIFAGLNQVGFVPPEALALDAQAFAKGQFWRPLTAASFLGGLGAQLLQKCYYLIQFGCGLERTLGSGEYLRVLASSTALLCIICNVLGWQFVGDGLVMAITVLTCQQTPDAQVNMYGLNIPSSYLPFAQLCMSYLFTQQIPWMDILGALVGYVHYQINENTKPDSYIHAKQLASGEIKAGGAAERPGARTLGSSGGAGGSKKLAAAKKGKKSALAKKAKSGSKPDGATCGPDGCSL